MARVWAQLGFVVLRTDLSGSGDSVRPGVAENEPYPPRAIADVRAAMDLLEDRFSARRFVVAGVCSGADIAFCAGVEEPRVAGVLIVNPRTFALYNIPSLEQLVRAHHLVATVSAEKNWRMLLRGEAGLSGSLHRIAQVARTAAVSLRGRLLSLVGKGEGPPPVPDVPRQMRRMLARGVDTLLVVGERDVGIMYLEIFFREELRALTRIPGFRRVDFRGTDHLYTALPAQDLLLETLTGHLRQSYP
jgi:pimeloyl-ACP methyl ester carboxylesterase